MRLVIGPALVLSILSTVAMRRLEAGGLVGQGGSARCTSLVTPAFPRGGRFLYHLRGGLYQTGRMRWPVTPVRSSRLPIDPNAKSRPQDNPDFDDLVLDEALYRELGITEEELREQRERTAADVADPEGFDLGFDDISSLNENVPMDLRLRLLDKGVFGPEVCRSAQCCQSMVCCRWDVCITADLSTHTRAVLCLPTCRQSSWQASDWMRWLW